MALTTTTGDGNWSNAGIWDSGVPSSGDDAVVANLVTLDTDAEFKSLTVNDSARLTLDANDRVVTVDDGGEITISASGRIDAVTNAPSSVTWKAKTGATKWNWHQFDAWYLVNGDYAATTGENHFENVVFESITDGVQRMAAGTWYFDEDCDFVGTHSGGGSYRIMTDAVFAAGKTFQIYNNGGGTDFGLRIGSNATIVGSEGNEITFTCPDAYTQKGNFSLTDLRNDVVTIDHCIFEYLRTGLYTVTIGGITTIRNSEFRNNINGTNLTTSVAAGSQINFENCKFYNNSRYGYYVSSVAWSDYKGILTDCEFYGNTTDGIFIRDGRGADGGHVIERCKIYSNGDDGIVYGSGEWLAPDRITNCLIYENTDYGILGSPDGHGDTIVRNCTLYNNDSGDDSASIRIASSAGGLIEIVSCTIVGGRYGIWKYDGGTPSVRYTNVYGATTSNYQDMDDPTGRDGNISSDPIFEDAYHDNYHLDIYSPCFGHATASGMPLVDLDGRDRLSADMGCYRYHDTVGNTGDWSNSGTWDNGIPTQYIIVGASGNIDVAASGAMFAYLDADSTITLTQDQTWTINDDGMIDHDDGEIDLNDNDPNVTFTSASGIEDWTWKNMVSGVFDVGAGDKHFEYATLRWSTYKYIYGGSWYFDEDCTFINDSDATNGLLWRNHACLTFAQGKTFTIDGNNSNRAYLAAYAGRLYASGVPEHRITFRSNDGLGYAYTYGTDTYPGAARLEYCDFDGMYHGYYLSGIKEDTDFYIDNCNFYNSTEHGIYINAFGVEKTITNCNAYNNGDYGFYHYPSTDENARVILENCESYSNTSAGFYIGTKNGGWEILKSKAYSNMYGIYYYPNTQNTKIENCLIYDNSYSGVTLGGVNADANNRIYSTTFYNNDSYGTSNSGTIFVDMRTGDEHGLEIRNCIINGGERGVKLYTDQSVYPDMFNNNVYGCTNNYVTIPDQTGTNGNISGDPKFVWADSRDFRIYPNSASFMTGCAASGVPSDDIVGNSRPIIAGLTPSMGAYENILYTETTANGDWSDNANWDNGFPTMWHIAEVEHNMTVASGVYFGRLYNSGDIEFDSSPRVINVISGGLISSPSGTIDTDANDGALTVRMGEGYDKWTWEHMKTGVSQFDVGSGDHHFASGVFSWDATNDVYFHSPGCKVFFDEDFEFVSTTNNTQAYFSQWHQVTFKPGSDYVIGDGGTNRATLQFNGEVHASGTADYPITFTGGGLDQFEPYSQTTARLHYCDFDSVMLQIYNVTDGGRLLIEDCNVYNTSNSGLTYRLLGGGVMKLNRCNFYGHTLDGIRWDAQFSEGVEINKCTAYSNSETGIRVRYSPTYGGKEILRDCSSYENSQYGFSFTNLSSTQSPLIEMDNCLAYDNDRHGCWIEDNPWQNSAIRNCTFADNNQAASTYSNLAIGARQTGHTIYLANVNTYGAYYGINTTNSDDVVAYNCNAYGASNSNYYGYNPVGISGNISVDPLFTSTTRDNYHLLYNSPMINAGTITASGIKSYDLDGHPRPFAAGVEATIGCYEPHITETTQVMNWSASGLWTNGLPTENSYARVLHTTTIDDDIEFMTLYNEETLTSDASGHTITVMDNGLIHNASGTIDTDTNDSDNTFTAYYGDDKWNWEIDNGTFDYGEGTHTFEYGNIFWSGTTAFTKGIWTFNEPCYFYSTVDGQYLRFDSTVNFTAGKTHVISDSTNSCRLQFRGNVNMPGTSGNEIVFDGNGGKGFIHWNVSGTRTGTFQYVNIDDALYGFYASSISASDTFVMENCNFSNSAEYGVWVNGHSGDITFKDTNVYNSGSIGYRFTAASAGSVTLQNCDCYSNASYGIYLSGLTAGHMVSGCYSYSNALNGIRGQQGGDIHDQIIENSVIYYNAIGATVYDAASSRITNCTFFDNGDESANILIDMTGSENNLLINNCTITGAKYGIHTTGSTEPFVDHCNVWGAIDSNYEGMPDFGGSSGNISEHPRFYEADSFVLSYRSPCLRAGSMESSGVPNVDYLDDDRPYAGLRPSIGAYEEPPNTTKTIQAGDWNTNANWTNNFPTYQHSAIVLHDMTVDSHINFEYLENWADIEFEYTATRAVNVHGSGLINNASGTLDFDTNDPLVCNWGVTGPSDNWEFPIASGITKWGQVTEHHFENVDFTAAYQGSVNNESGSNFWFDSDVHFYCYGAGPAAGNIYFSDANIWFTKEQGRVYTLGNGTNSFRLIMLRCNVAASGSEDLRIEFDGNNQTGMIYNYGHSGDHDYVYKYCDFHDCSQGLYFWLFNDTTSNNTVTVENCTFYDNQTRGLNMSGMNGTYFASGCLAYNNGTVGMEIGGTSGDLGFIDCSGYNNTTYGIYFGTHNSTAINRADRCYAYGNSTIGIGTYPGYLEVGRPQFKDCVAYENTTYGLAHSWTASGVMENCTSVDNTLGNYWTFLRNDDWGEIVNCISASGAYGVYANLYTNASYKEPNVKFSNIYGATTANYYGYTDQTALRGNISENPDFVDIDNNNYRLTVDSPCINAATPSGITYLDAGWYPRPMPVGSLPDMGAFEEQTVDHGYVFWTNGNGTYLFSEAGNWSNNAVPGLGDNAYYKAGWDDDCTVDSVVNLGVGNFHMASGYAGTVTANANIDCSGFFVESGTFELNSYELDTIGFIYSGGDLTREIDLGSGTVLYQKDWDTSGSNLTFNYGTSLVRRDGGTADHYVNAGNAEFYDWEPKYYYYWKILELRSDVIVNNNFNIPSYTGTIPINGASYKIYIKGSIRGTGSGSHLITGDLGGIEYNGTGAQEIEGDTVNEWLDFAIPLTINKSSGTLTLLNRIGFRSDLIHQNGTVDYGTSSVRFWGYSYGTVTINTNNESLQFYNVYTGPHDSEGIILDGGDVIINNDFTINTTASQTKWYKTTNEEIHVKGDIKVSAATYHTHMEGDVPIIINGTGDQTFEGEGGSYWQFIENPIYINKSGGTLTLQDRIAFGERLEHQNGTVDYGTSTVMFRISSGNTTLNSNSGTLQFYNVETHSYQTNLILDGGDLIINNDLELVNTGGNNIEITKTGSEKIQVKGNLELADSGGSRLAGNVDMELNGTGNQYINGYTDTGYKEVNLTISKPTGTLYITGDFEWGRTNKDTGWVYASGTVDPGTSKITFIRSTLDCDGMSFYDVDLEYNCYLWSPLDVDNDLTITTTGSPIMSASGYQINIGGSLDNQEGATGLELEYAKVVFDGSDTDNTITQGGVEFHDLEFNGAGKWTSQEAITVNKDLTVTQGTFNLEDEDLTMTASGTLSNEGTIALYGDQTMTSVTMDTDSGTIEYNGTGTYASLPFGNNYNHLSFTGAGSYTLDGELDCKNFTLSNGTFDSGGYDMYIGGDWTHYGGTFVHNNNTVIFDGNPVDQYIYGSNTFYNLTLTNGDRTVYFEHSQTQTVYGSLVITGTEASQSHIKLRSTHPTLEWFLTWNGTTSQIMWVDVQLSNASGGYEIVATDLSNIDSGENTNWLFYVFPPITNISPSGFPYEEYYLYSNKAWEVVPSGSRTYNTEHAILQNAPVIVTPSGFETTTPDQPWGQISGSGKLTNVAYGGFTLDAAGVPVTNIGEYYIDPDSSGTIIFNNATTFDLFVEYEAGPSGYYILDSVDFNPMRAESESGFVHFSQITDPASLYLMTSQTTLRADGYQSAKLTATLYDEDYDRTPDRSVIFEIQNVNEYSYYGYLQPYDGSVYRVDGSGLAIQVLETTNSRGEAKCRYVTKELNTGVVDLKAYYLDASGIYDIVQIAQYYISAGPFILDLSLLDMLDYLT